LLQSEYGWTRDYIYHHVTPAEMLAWADAIHKRRLLHDATTIELAYIAFAGAQGGRKAWRAMRRTVKRMRRQAGVREKSNWKRLAEQMGLMKMGER